MDLCPCQNQMDSYLEESAISFSLILIAMSPFKRKVPFAHKRDSANFVYVTKREGVVREH